MAFRVHAKKFYTYARLTLVTGVLAVSVSLVYPVLFKQPSLAFDTEQSFPQDTEEGYGDFKPIEAKDGALSWDVFSAVKEIPYEEPDPADPSLTVYGVKPSFTKDIQAVDGTRVRLMGYMFPLDPSEEQSNFLFGPYPPTCGFHYHANANQVLEVSAKKPIKFSWEPIAIEGVFHLAKPNQDNVFYRMKDAVLKKAY